LLTPSRTCSAEQPIAVVVEDDVYESRAAVAALADVGAATDTTALKATVRKCDRKLDRCRKAIEAGTDPTVVAGWIKQVTAGRATAQAQLVEAGRTNAETVTADEAIGGLLPLLELSDMTVRSKF
jgi:hypothetical protein